MNVFSFNKRYIFLLFAEDQQYYFDLESQKIVSMYQKEFKPAASPTFVVSGVLVYNYLKSLHPIASSERLTMLCVLGGISLIISWLVANMWVNNFLRKSLVTDFPVTFVEVNKAAILKSVNMNGKMLLITASVYIPSLAVYLYTGKPVLLFVVTGLLGAGSCIGLFSNMSRRRKIARLCQLQVK